MIIINAKCSTYLPSILIIWLTLISISIYKYARLVCFCILNINRIFTFKPFNLSTAFGKGSICFLSFEQFAGVSGKSNEVFEYMSRTFDVTHVSPSIGPFFNLIPGISPQRRNEMEVGSKLRDKSDLVSNRRHYIQTLPRFVLLYFGTPPKRGKSIQPKISVFSEELLKKKVLN